MCVWKGGRGPVVDVSISSKIEEGQTRLHALMDDGNRWAEGSLLPLQAMETYAPPPSTFYHAHPPLALARSLIFVLLISFSEECHTSTPSTDTASL